MDSFLVYTILLHLNIAQTLLWAEKVFTEKGVKFMSIKRTMLAAAATLALSVPAWAAQISPANEAVTAGSEPKSTLTLIMHGGGGFGGMHGGGGFAMHGGGFGGMHMGGIGPRFGPGGHFGFGHRAFLHGGHPAFFHGRHGFFRHGHFFPFGVGFYGVGYGDGGSCYWNCRAAGFGAGYCSVYSWNFCY
jgi:hypothetical protein